MVAASASDTPCVAAGEPAALSASDTRPPLVGGDGVRWSDTPAPALATRRAVASGTMPHTAGTPAGARRRRAPANSKKNGMSSPPAMLEPRLGRTPPPARPLGRCGAAGGAATAARAAPSPNAACHSQEPQPSGCGACGACPCSTAGAAPPPPLLLPSPGVNSASSSGRRAVGAAARPTSSNVTAASVLVMTTTTDAATPAPRHAASTGGGRQRGSSGRLVSTLPGGDT